MRSILISSACLTLLAPLLACRPVRAQLDWGGTSWRVEASEFQVERFEGREVLRLTNGTAWVEDVSLRDGSVSVDVYMSAELGFHGVAFRALDDANYEHVYVRPFVSGQPDATQYTPVFNGVTGWQLYAGPHYATALPVPTERWVRLEVRFRSGRAAMYLDGRPAVFPALERSPAAGALGLTSSGAPARFANVRVSTSPPTLSDAGTPAPAADLPSGSVARWRVSTPFAEADLTPTADLSPEWTAGLQWDSLEAGPRGIANLAKLRNRSATANTVFAAATLHADAPRRARIRLGFSDRVRAYLNGTPVYHGADRWRSRDYKFLGTVGLFDELVLPLRAGENELWLAVSEDFGGWGVTLQVLDDEIGVSSSR